MDKAVTKIQGVPGQTNSMFGNIGACYWAVLFAAAVLYAISCAPGALWQDSGMIQYRVLHNDIEGGLGLALSHPLFYMIAIVVKYLPFGPVLWKINMVSSMAAAFAVANLFLLLRLWLDKFFPAVIGALTFAVSHTFWRHGSVVETYTLFMALFLAGQVMLLQYVRTRRMVFLYSLGLFSGLSIADHMLASIPLLCYAVFLLFELFKKRISVGQLVIFILIWSAGASPYLYLILKNLAVTGDLTGVVMSAMFGNSWQGDVLNTGLSFGLVKENVLFFLLNFPTPNLILFFMGLFAASKISYGRETNRSFQNIHIALLIMFLVFAFRYTIVDRYAFFIPFYCMVSIFIALGVCFVADRIKGVVPISVIVVFALLPVGVYIAAPTLARKAYPALAKIRQIPYRDTYDYFLRPWKTGYHGADDFADEALALTQADDLIYADGTTVYPLVIAQQLRHAGQDAIVVSGHGTIKNAGDYGADVVSQLLNERDIYVVSAVAGYCPKFLFDNYDFVECWPLYRVVDRGQGQ